MPPHPVHALSLSHKKTPALNLPTPQKQDTYDSGESITRLSHAFSLLAFYHLDGHLGTFVVGHGANDKPARLG